MAIAYDSFSSGTDNTPNSSPATQAHTCTGSNGLLATGFYTAAATSKTTSVTYAGASMTQATKLEGSPASSTTEIWYKLSPATGANNIVITCSADQPIEYCSASYTGVGGLDATNTGSNASTSSFAVSITTVADNSWPIMFARNNGDVYTAGASTTKRASQGASAIFDSNAAKTPAGSVTLTATTPLSYSHGASLMSISPFVAATARRLALLGVG